MERKGFYLTVPSNASYDTFPDNTQSTFKIRTATPIDLSGYTVALTEIHYPNSWNNIKDASFTLQSAGRNDRRTIRLLPGRYTSIEQLIAALQKQIEVLGAAGYLIILWDKIQRKTLIDIRQDGAVLSISKQLAQILGFRARRFAKGVHTSDYQSDIDEGMSAIYVYSSIVQNQLVGDSLVPLLRVVPIRGRSDDVYRSEEFLHPYYLTATNKTTSELRFYLRRDDGTDISFSSGKVVLTLHFRPI